MPDALGRAGDRGEDGHRPTVSADPRYVGRMAADRDANSDTGMRAVVVPEHGDIDALDVQERPRPEPGPGQLLVRVAASGINFMDVYRRRGVYPVSTPFVLGSECAGRVV